jgi:hypothetical protein
MEGDLTYQKRCVTIPCAMSSEAAPTMLVLIKALVLARSSGASEIGIDHLLAALEAESSSVDPAAPPEGTFFPVPRQDMALSRGAATAIARLGDISTIPLDVLRNVLLSAKGQGAH